MPQLKAAKDRIEELWPIRYQNWERESIRSLVRLAKKITHGRKHKVPGDK